MALGVKYQYFQVISRSDCKQDYASLGAVVTKDVMKILEPRMVIGQNVGLCDSGKCNIGSNPTRSAIKSGVQRICGWIHLNPSQMAAIMRILNGNGTRESTARIINLVLWPNFLCSGV
jgi:hypothetical protein